MKARPFFYNRGHVLTQILGNKKITIILFLLLLSLVVLAGLTGKVSANLLIMFALPLAVNLLCCIYEHTKRIKLWNVKRAGFVLFHIGFLIVITGGMITYLTYSIG